MSTINSSATMPAATLNRDAQSRLAGVRRRIFSIALGFSAGWSISAILALLILGAWIDLAVELSAALRVIVDLAAIIVGLAVGVSLLMRALRSASLMTLAQRLDKLAGAHGEIVAGLDLTLTPIETESSITRGLAQIAAARAASLIQRVSPKTAAPISTLKKPIFSVGGIILVLVIVAISSPRLLWTQWLRFVDPAGDHPPYSALQFDVKPGDARIAYGGALDVRAKTLGAAADRLDLVYVPAGQTEQIVPMFPEGDGAWRATLANLTSPGTYILRSGRARTTQFNLDIATVPQIQKVSFKVTLPAYTHRAPYVGALPPGGLAGLPGTTVEVDAQSNRPLAGGNLTITGTAATQSVPMTGSGNEATGSFVISAPGKFNLTLTDIKGQSSTDSFAGTISLLADEKPFIRILQPPSTSFATPDATIKIVALAEDDYGVSQLQIYRGLNDSLFRAEDIVVPPSQPTRFPGSTTLRLSDYSLSAGDEVKLFARVMDNDPAGAKGAESKVVLIHIISQADLDKLAMARNAMQVLLSKYSQAQRRLEALDKQAADLEKKLAADDPSQKLSDDEQKQMNDLAKQLSDAANDLNKLASHGLPVDIDKNLTQEISKVADGLAQAAASTSQAAAAGGLSGAMLDKIKALRSQLDQQKKDYNNNAQAPLAHLAKIIPLISDERSYVELSQHQQDLADRLSSLETVNGNDDPQLKARMRDLEDEQRGVRDRLQQLLDDITSRANALPDDPQLDELRNTARDFAKAVGASPADGQMQQAQAALDDFKGTPASTDAHDAAKTLASFISHCNAMGTQAKAALKFQPSLSQALGDSVAQLMGMGGTGLGGGGGGFSASANSLQNVGIYGTIPLAAQESGNGGQADGDVASQAAANPNPDQNPGNALVKGGQHAQGTSDAPVPPQYQKRVGDYFHRVEDELSN